MCDSVTVTHRPWLLRSIQRAFERGAWTFKASSDSLRDNNCHTIFENVSNDTAPTTKKSHLNLGFMEVLIITIAVVGLLANLIVLHAMRVSNHKAKSQQPINTLFFNQLILDLFSCTSLIIIHSLNLADVHLVGTAGHYACMFVFSGALVWYGVVGSAVNLASIAVERYVMVVHPIWHRKSGHPGIIKAAVFAAWINGVLAIQPAVSVTSTVVNGTCKVCHFPSEQMATVYHAWFTGSYFGIVFILIVYCHLRIALTCMRRRLALLATQRIRTSTPKRSWRLEMSAVKTMTLISIVFTVCWLPLHIFSLVTFFKPFRKHHNFIAYQVVCLVFLSCSLNPFIYAARYDPVKRYLGGLITCCSTKRRVSFMSTTHSHADVLSLKRGNRDGGGKIEEIGDA